MKKILTLIFFCSSSIIFSLPSNPQNENFEDKWDKYTNPNTDNYIYYHFKKYISNDLVSAKSFPDNTSKIILEFNLDSIYNLENIRVNTKSKKLNDLIIRVFKKIDFTKINIQSASKYHNYSLQILVKENGKAILKCSSSILHEVPALNEDCEKSKDFESYYLCFKSKLENYLYKNIDSAKVAHLDFNNDTISIKAHININGKVNITNNAKNEVLKNEITTILSDYNFNIASPATINGNQVNYTYEVITYDRRLIKTWLYKTSSQNNLAFFFKENIPEHIINQEPFNDKKSSISINFSLDKKGKLERVTSSAKNEELDKYLVNTFKKYPIEKLNIPNRIHNLSRYHFKVIDLEASRNRIECSNYIFSETLPIVGDCSKSKTFESLKTCNQKSISNFVYKNFDANLASNLGLTPGVKRIFVFFKISKTGEITDVKARAPHKALSEEAIQVVKKIKVFSPAHQLGKPVGVKFSLPIAFKVTGGEPKTEYPAFEQYGIQIN